MPAPSRPGLLLMRSLRPPADRREDVRGRCSVCGADTRFAFNSWILPREMRRDLADDRLVRAFCRRESRWCAACGSNERVRRIASALLEHYADRAQTLAQLVEEPAFRELRIAEVNSVGAAHEVLAAHPGLSYSEFPEEDLRALSYADAEFDLVLTSDTLEHVDGFEAALAETRRVLKEGGRHLFTVPVDPGRAATVVRARGDEHLEPPQHHGRASGPFRLLTRRVPDMLAYTDFGMDLEQLLAAAGFETELHFPPSPGDVSFVWCATAAS
jgi:SAM-dependent methyltransferase